MTKSTWLTDKERGIVVSCFTIVFIFGADSFIISPLLPTIASQFQTNISHTALAISLYAFFYAVGAPIFGPISDHWGQKKALKIGLSIFFVTSLACAIAPNLILFDIFRAGAGIGAAFSLPNIWAIIGQSFAGAKLNQAMGITMSALSLSIAIGVPLGSWLAQLTNWQLIFYLSAAGVLFAGWCLFHFMPESLEHFRPQRSQQKFKWREILPVVLVTFNWMLGFYLIYSFLGTFLNQKLHLTLAQTGLIFTIYGTSNFLASFFAGTSTTHLGAKTSVLLNGSLSALITGFIAIFGNNLEWLGFLLCLLAITQGLGVPATATYLVKLSPTFRTTSMALNNTSLYLALTLSGVIGGYLQPLINFQGLSSLAALFFSIATISTFWWRQIK